MSSSAKATLRLQFANEKQVTTIFNALTPEAKALSTRRATVKLEEDGLFLILDVAAEDTVALRATLNAYLHWINSVQSVIGTVENL
jgi:tRNA threonylcarbamoyladenosine modification (KEOPS) complex  Pcc1 subunit